MELGKEAMLVVQIPAPLLPTQGAWTVVVLRSPRFTAVGQPPLPQVQALSRWPGPVQRSGRAEPSLLHFPDTHSLCTLPQVGASSLWEKNLGQNGEG